MLLYRLENCNNGARVVPTDPPTTEPVPVETEAPAVTVAPKDSAPEEGPGGAAGDLKMNSHVLVAALILSVITAVFHM